MSAPRTIVLAAGGTGGHVYPAIAVAEELSAHGLLTPLFVGGGKGVERRVVQQYGYRFRQFHAAPFERTGLGGKLLCLASLARGFVEARRILIDENAAAVIAFGGYVSVAPILAARSLGIPTILHEANAEFGLANRFLAGRVNALLCSFDTACRDDVKAEVVGMPVRQAIRRREEDTPSSERFVLVLSGTEPSEFFVQYVPSLIARVAAAAGTIRVIHQTASADNAVAIERYRQLGIDAAVTGYLEDIAAAYARATFVISRVGASTMAEIALRGIPAMMVPDPRAAANHQAQNALLFRDRGGVLTVDEANWNEEVLAPQVARLLADPQFRGDAVLKVRKLANPAAASVVASTATRLAAMSPLIRSR